MRLTSENIQKFQGYNLTAKETSYLGLRPGDIIQFRYPSTRLGVVVASARTSSGIFLSPRNNLLMNVILLDRLSEGLFSVIVNNLYNNDYVSNYTNMPIITGFTKSDSFRTFKVGSMSDIIKLDIDITREGFREY